MLEAQLCLFCDKFRSCSATVRQPAKLGLPTSSALQITVHRRGRSDCDNAIGLEARDSDFRDHPGAIAVTFRFATPERRAYRVSGHESYLAGCSLMNEEEVCARAYIHHYAPSYLLQPDRFYSPCQPSSLSLCCWSNYCRVAHVCPWQGILVRSA